MEKEYLKGYRGMSYFKMNIAVVFFKIPPQGLAYLYEKGNQQDLKIYDDIHGISTAYTRKMEQELAKSIN